MGDSISSISSNEHTYSYDTKIAELKKQQQNPSIFVNPGAGAVMVNGNSIWTNC